MVMTKFQICKPHTLNIVQLGIFGHPSVVVCGYIPSEYPDNLVDVEVLIGAIGEKVPSYCTMY